MMKKRKDLKSEIMDIYFGQQSNKSKDSYKSQFQTKRSSKQIQ